MLKNAKFLINFNEKYKNFAGTFDPIFIIKTLRGSRLQIENTERNICQNVEITFRNQM